MAISLTRLSGGNTPADGSDPRTFPAIWNASATAIETAIDEAGGGGATGGGGAINLNLNSITENYTFEDNYNGVSAGPVTIASGVTVTIGALSAWSIV